jgi:uncharacterized membrane protein
VDRLQTAESLLRWLHVTAGALFVGGGVFSTWALSRQLSALSEETRRSVLPALLPRAYGFLRWSSLLAWISGFFLLPLVYYHGRLHLDPAAVSTRGSGVMIAVAFLGFGLYDGVFARIRSGVAQLVLGVVLIVAYSEGLVATGFSYRGQSIHLGALLGTVMVANLWMRVWPNQRRGLEAMARGEAPDPARMGLAAERARHNASLAAPLLFAMMAQHGTWLASVPFGLSILTCGALVASALAFRPR